jgi:hypothetical protein
MAAPTRTMSQNVREFWIAATGQKHPARKAAAPVIVLHDPAAKRAHDLDDPFFDRNAQLRAGCVIAGTGHKK